MSTWNRAISLIYFLLFFFSYANSAITFGNRYSTIEITPGTTFNVANSGMDFGGTLVKENNGSISGGIVTFQSGLFEENSGEFFLKAQYDPASSEIRLAGTQSSPNQLRAEPGPVFQTIKVENTYNKLEGQPILYQPVQLLDSSASLTIAIHGALDQNIELNSGTLYLDNDLELADGVKLSNGGIVDLNGHSLKFGGRVLTLTDSIYWDSPTDIHMNSKISLSGTWTFSNTGNLNGNGNILDLTNGGTLYIESGATLYLTDVIVKGIGSGWITMADQTSQIRLANTTFETTTTYTVWTGGVYVEGLTNFNLRDKNWHFDGNSSLTVDGTVLWTDRLNTPTISRGEITFETPEANYLGLINSGTIRARSALEDYIDLEDRLVDCINDVETFDSRMNTAETDINSLQADMVEAQSDVDDLEATSVYLEGKINTNVGNISTNEGNISTNATGISNNLTAINNNSGAIVTHETRIDVHDTSIANNETAITNNSNAIIVHETRLDTAETDIINNSNAIVTHETRIDGHDTSIANNETAITNNSNAIVVHETRINTNSTNLTSTYNYLDTLITNTMDDVWQQINDLDVTSLENRVDILETTSVYLDNRITSTMNDVHQRIDGLGSSEGIINNSNAIIALDARLDTAETDIINNSNAIVTHETRIDGHDTSIANNETAITNNSNAIVVHETILDTAETDIANNSNAIVTHKTRIDGHDTYIANNATAITNNSNAIVAHETILDTAETDIANNSNAIVTHETRIDAHDTSIANNETAITNNSNAIVVHETRINTNSTNLTSTYNYLNTLITNTMDDVWQQINDLDVTSLENRVDILETTSVYLDNRITSTMNDVHQRIDGLGSSEGIINNSNAIIALDAKLDTAETDIINNSNAIVTHETRIDTHDTSIANNETAITNNSNAIVVHETRLDTAETDIVNNSNAIITHETRIDGHDTSIANNETAITNNSNTIVVHETRLDTAETDIVNNSNAIVTHETRIDGHDTSIANNETAITNNSNAIVVHETRLDTAETDIVNNSNAIVVHETRIDAHDTSIATNIVDILNNSNTIVGHETRILDNSNAVYALDSTGSLGDFTFLITRVDNLDTATNTLTTDVTNNSNAIVTHETRLDILETTSAYLENEITKTYNALSSGTGSSVTQLQQDVVIINNQLSIIQKKLINIYPQYGFSTPPEFLVRNIPLNSETNLENASGWITLDRSIGYDFSTDPSESLVLYMNNGAQIHQRTEGTTLKTDDVLLISGKENTFYLSEDLVIKGTVLLEKGAELTCKVVDENIAPRIMFAPKSTLIIQKDATLLLEGNGTIETDKESNILIDKSSRSSVKNK